MTPKERAAIQPSQQAVAAMRLALEALKFARTQIATLEIVSLEDACDEAITALRSALADSAASSSEALAEPDTDTMLWDSVEPRKKAEQAEQVSMKVCRHCGFLCKPNDNDSKKWYPLEQSYAKNNEKRSNLNTEHEPDAICDHSVKPMQQEPVAWMFVNDDGECEEIGYGKDYLKGSEMMADFQPLFSAPLRTKDLTDDEILEINQYTTLQFARAVIAKFKEKNK